MTDLLEALASHRRVTYSGRRISTISCRAIHAPCCSSAATSHSGRGARRRRRRPRAADELPGRLRLGLIDRRDEAALMARFGVVVTPAVVYMRDASRRNWWLACATGRCSRKPAIDCSPRDRKSGLAPEETHDRHVLVWHPKVPGEAPAGVMINCDSSACHRSHPAGAAALAATSSLRRPGGNARSAGGPAAAAEAPRGTNPHRTERSRRSGQGDRG